MPAIDRRGMRTVPHARRIVEHRAFGSPIAKFRYFRPLLVGYRRPRLLLEDEQPVRASCMGNVLGCERLTFYNPLDLVSGKLTPLPGFSPSTNIRVLEPGLIASHVRYERNAEFLGTIVPRLFGKEVNLRRSISPQSVFCLLTSVFVRVVRQPSGRGRGLVGCAPESAVGSASSAAYCRRFLKVHLD